MFLSQEVLFFHELSKEIAEAMKDLWKENVIKNIVRNFTCLTINEGSGFYFDELDRISGPNYLPSDQDILHARARTTGVHEVYFEMGNAKFQMVDVGGQRTERRKWIHCFQDVKAVIFCVALSEYNMNLYEDNKANRMHESLSLYREICTTSWFKTTTTILFLNKSDVFHEKIQKVDLVVAFPEYTGGCDEKKALEFIKEKFRQVHNESNSEKKVYCHITCATSTDNIRSVFNAIRDTILHTVIARDF